MKSDIFENFLKIAEDKKLLNLYNVKPDSIYDGDNIIDDAHKEPVFVLPAHDKVNGLIPNENEHQNIMLNLVNKRPTGTYTAHKLAADQALTLNLIRLGNVLDGKNDDLRRLSDKCLEQAKYKNELRKEAFAWGVAAAIAAASLVLGGWFYSRNSDMANQGLHINQETLDTEIADLTKDTKSWGTGHKFRQEFKDEMIEFRRKIHTFGEEYEKIISTLDEIQKPRTGKELIEYSKTIDNNKIKSTFENLKAKADDMKSYIMTVDSNFNSETYKNMQILEKGVLTSLWDKIPGSDKAWSDNFKDVQRAIHPYLKSIEEILSVLEKSSKFMKDSKEKMEEAAKESTESQKKSDEMAKQVADEMKNKKPETENKPEHKSLEDSQEDIEKDLKKILGG